MIDLRAVRTIKFQTAEPIAGKVIELFEGGQFDVCTLFYARFKSVISQIPTAQQLIPPELAPKNELLPVYHYEPDETGCFDFDEAGPIPMETRRGIHQPTPSYVEQFDRGSDSE